MKVDLGGVVEGVIDEVLDGYIGVELVVIIDVCCFLLWVVSV